MPYTPPAACPLAVSPLPARPLSTPHLTGRQAEVLAMIAAGRTQKQAAQQLGLSKKSIEVHLGQARRRAGCLTTGHLIAAAVRAGLV